MNAHPSQIDLTDMRAPTPLGSGRLSVSATLLAWCAAIIPIPWMTAMVLLALAVRY